MRKFWKMWVWILRKNLLSAVFGEYYLVSDARYLKQKFKKKADFLQVDSCSLTPWWMKSSQKFLGNVSSKSENDNYHLIFKPGLTVRALKRIQRRFPRKTFFQSLGSWFGAKSRKQGTGTWRSISVKYLKLFRWSCFFLLWRFSFKNIESNRTNQTFLPCFHFSKSLKRAELSPLGRKRKTFLEAEADMSKEPYFLGTKVIDILEKISL